MVDDMKKLVTVVIVTYNSSRFLANCLEQLTVKNRSGIVDNIIIVDNCSKDNTLDIAKRFEVKIIETSKNLGYGRAANIGIRTSRTKYVLVMNPDVYVKKGTIDAMARFMEYNPECDIQGPKLLDMDDNLIYSCRTFPTAKIMFARRSGLLKEDANKHLMKDYDHKTPKRVDWVSGGCIMIKRRILFDERYFLYFEDVDLCVGRVVYYNPRAIAYHGEQRESTKKLKPLMMHMTSLIKFKLKHLGRNFKNHQV